MNMESKIVPATEGVSPPRRLLGRLSRGQRGALVLLPLAAAGAAVGLVGREPAATAAPPLPVVTVAAPIVRQVNEWDEHIGRFEASRAVEVRPRVAGAVIGVHFRDGEIVRAGQLLFTIDPRPFAAALAEAQAGIQSAQSELSLAREDLGRATRLLDVEAVSRSDVDRLQARVRSGEAALAAAQARARSRALDLEFTRVRAPIAGRVSDRRVDAGNLVGAGESAGGTLLTTINALDPIYFSFDGSEALFLKMKRAEQARSAATVQVRLQDETDYRWRGKLDFTDNALDTRSGTIRGRAVLRNPGLFLTPGMFGNMRLSTGSTAAALLVPDSAVQTDQARRVVLVLARDGGVTPKPVQLGPVVDGLRIIRSGLSPSDQVVIAGGQLVLPGAKVDTKPGRIAPVATASPIAATNPPGGEATLAFKPTP
jgi:RND family efflux transporter MFP subunit